MAGVVILGIFVADAAYRTERLPRMGQTLMGRGFTLGPGGKGSNQAVAAARAGAETAFLTRLGTDTFADMARGVWREAGVRDLSIADAGHPTGSACILIDDDSGDNAIIVVPGAAGHITRADVDSWADTIAGADVFVTQLEQPLDAAQAALARARAAGAVTILDPAPATDLPDGMLSLCDYVTPNETEAEALTGIAVAGVQDATRAAERLLSQGAGAAIITLGEQGVLVHDGTAARHVPPVITADAVDTTGAGDAFTGAFAAALARGRHVDGALRFAVTAASLSVTRPGAAAAMAEARDIEMALAEGDLPE